MTTTPTPPQPPTPLATADPGDEAGPAASVPLQNHRTATSSPQDGTEVRQHHAPRPEAQDSQPRRPVQAQQAAAPPPETVGPGCRPEWDDAHPGDGDGHRGRTSEDPGGRDGSAPRSARAEPARGLPAPSGTDGLPRPRPSTAARKGPPGRRDSRRPDAGRPGTPKGRPSASALRAAALRERERQPPYWFARQLLLVLSGQAPVHTLLRYVHSDAYEQLAALAPLAPLRPRGADRRTPALLEARGSRPRDGVIEAFARVATGGRQRAMAFRLEYDTQRRWLCAAVELDGLSGVSTRARA